MKRVVLAIVGIGLLLFLAVPILHFWFIWVDGAPGRQGKQQIVDDLMWATIKSTGDVVAQSRNDPAFNFMDIGDLALSSRPLVQSVLDKLSHATSMRIERGPDKGWSIGIFHDTQVFTRLKSDKQRFRQMGLPDHIIGFMDERVTDDDTRCFTMTRTDDEQNIVLTIILSSQQSGFERCVVGGLLNSFGIRSAETVSASDLVSACVLYKTRRAGVRHRQQLLETMSAFRDGCQKETANALQ